MDWSMELIIHRVFNFFSIGVTFSNTFSDLMTMVYFEKNVWKATVTCLVDPLSPMYSELQINEFAPSFRVIWRNCANSWIAHFLAKFYWTIGLSKLISM